jgi:hypothetical protein
MRRGELEPHKDRQDHDKRAKKVFWNANRFGNVFPKDVHLVGGREPAHQEHVESQDGDQEPKAVAKIAEFV